MKRLNVKLLAGLGALGLVLGAGAFLAHRFQVGRTARALLREAEAEERLGRLDRAGTGLGRYLSLRPEDTEALARRATLLDRMATTSKAKLGACLAYEQVLRRDPGRSEARLRLAGLAMELGRVANARDDLERALPALADRPGLRARADEMIARCRGRLGDRDGEVAAYRRAIADDPLWTVPRLGLASALAARGRVVEADRVLRDLPDALLASSDLLRLSSGLALRSSDTGRAIDLARRSAALHPGDAREQLWLGQVLWSADRLPEAEAALRRATELGGDDPEPWVALVQFLVGKGHPEQAEAAIGRAEHALTKGQGASTLAQCHEAIGRDDRAEALYREAEEAHPDDPAVLRPSAIFFLRTDRPEEARARLRTVIDKAKDPADSAWARRTLALDLIADGDRPRAREALDLIAPLGDDPEDRRVAARVLVAQGDRRQARAAARELARLDDRGALADDDRALLARLDEADGDWPKAQERWRALLVSQPDNPLYLARFADGLRRHGRADEARALVDRLESLDPGSFRTAELKALVLHDLGRDDEAAAALRSAARRDDAPVEAVAALLEEIGRGDDAEAMYRESAARPGHPEAALDLAAFLGRRGRDGESLDLCDEAWTTCRPEQVAAVAVGVLAAPRADPSRINRVSRRIEEAVARSPDAAPLLVSLGAVRELQGRYREAEELYRRAIERDGGDGVPLNNLAWLTALREGDAPRALELIDRAIDLDGPEPELLDTRAVVYLSLGRWTEALDDLNEAVAATPSAPRLFHLAQAHLKADDRGAASEALGRARAMGLVAARLHPLEQPAYVRLIGELGGGR